MTEKELLYFEDAIGHEVSIISICNDIVNRLEDSKLKDFISKEIGIHEDNRNNLMNILEVKANE